MASTILRRLLQQSQRWPPYVLGWLGGIPVTVILVLLQGYCAICWIGWIAFSMFLGWNFFWRTRRRRVVTIALLVGTFGSFLVLGFVALVNYGHR
jgi:hypothetical protein